ncbi:MAG TPA: methyl-accepting chemotaxis protein [Myxococcales bacterium]|jgi:methyl-accepting chemotaxis protein
MSAPDTRDLRHASTRLVKRVALYHGIVGLVFLAYVTFLVPEDTGIRLSTPLYGGLALSFFGALLLLFTYLWLATLRRALENPGDAALVERASVAARRLPAVGSAVTLAFWILGGAGIYGVLLGAGLPRPAVSAGLVAGVCTGVVSTLLYYYLAIADLFAVRLALPGAQAPARGASIRTRIVITSLAILSVGITTVGATALLNHQFALERSAVSNCDHALKALVVIEAPTSSIVEAAAKACDGPAVVGLAGRVISSIGDAEIVNLPEGRNERGVLLTMPLRSGTTLYVLVSDKGWTGQEMERFGWRMLGFAGLAFVLAFLLAFVASQALTAPVRGLAEAAEAIARGDLTRVVPVLTRDEIGSLAQSFGVMSSGLRKLVGNISGAAESLSGQVGSVVSAGALVQRGAEVRREGVAGATREMTEMDHSVADVGRDVAGLNEYVATTGAALAEFAASLEEVRRHGLELERAVAGSRGEVQALLAAADSVRTEIAALAEASRSTLSTIGESGRTLQALGDAAREGERVAQRLFEETRAGAQVVDQSVRGVEAIRGVVAEAKSRVQALGERSTDITEVVDFIADVAGRTNLLSLNAAIIAAQAGEQGKPFGVVADHIRELASQIGSSTKRIADIIAGVKLEVEATSALIQESDELAATGVERAQEGGEALKRIAEESKKSREVSLSILPVVTTYTQTAQQIEQLAARVVEMAQGFEGVDLLARGGKSIEALAQSLEPLTSRVGRALEEQTAVSHKQVESLEEINRMIARLNGTVTEHADGTARVLKNLSALVSLADEDRRAVDELAHAAQALNRHAQALREGLEQFRM